MKKKINLIFVIYFFAFLILFISSANAITIPGKEPARSCKTFYQGRPLNQINFQIPHFVCCQCNDENCGCNEDSCSGNICYRGDAIRKKFNLLVASEYCTANCSFSGQADVNVYNYRGLDKFSINLRVNNLFPKKGTFSVWLVDSIDQSKTQRLGAFATNQNGNGYFSARKTLEDVSIFDGIKIYDQYGNLASSTTFNFICTK